MNILIKNDEMLFKRFTCPVKNKLYKEVSLSSKK